MIGSVGLFLCDDVIAEMIPLFEVFLIREDSVCHGFLTMIAGRISSKLSQLASVNFIRIWMRYKAH
jgi:hypothetical protein